MYFDASDQIKTAPLEKRLVRDDTFTVLCVTYRCLSLHLPKHIHPFPAVVPRYTPSITYMSSEVECITAYAKLSSREWLDGQMQDTSTPCTCRMHGFGWRSWVPKRSPEMGYITYAIARSAASRSTGTKLKSHVKQNSALKEGTLNQ